MTSHAHGGPPTPRNTPSGFAGRWRIAGWTTAALFLLYPLVAMQFTDEVDWTVADFLFAGALLAGVGGAFELAVRRTASTAYRLAVGVALAAAFLLVWINGAVGIFGSEDNPANLLFGVVLAVALAGSVAARFRPRGMAFAMAATALGQAVVAAVALAGGMIPENGWVEALALCGFFVALFAGAAWLFHEASRSELAD